MAKAFNRGSPRGISSITGKGLIYIPLFRIKLQQVYHNQYCPDVVQSEQYYIILSTPFCIFLNYRHQKQHDNSQDSIE